MMVDISFAFLVSAPSVSSVIRSTCKVLWEQLEPQVFRHVSEELWLDVARGFEEHWQLPNCVGALDGKHCSVQVCELGPNTQHTALYVEVGSNVVTCCFRISRTEAQTGTTIRKTLVWSCWQCAMLSTSTPSLMLVDVGVAVTAACSRGAPWASA